jgi:hypothetical protein
MLRADERNPTEGEAIMADDDTNNAQAHQQPPEPNPDLKSLERLVSTWEMSGGIQGRVTFEWMEGGFFLIQHVDLEQHGQKIKGIEIIGHERPFGAEPSEEIKSQSLASTATRATPSTTSTNWRGTPSRSGAGREVLRRMPRAHSVRTVTPAPVSGCTRVAGIGLP